MRVQVSLQFVKETAVVAMISEQIKMRKRHKCMERDTALRETVVQNKVL